MFVPYRQLLPRYKSRSSNNNSCFPRIMPFVKPVSTWNFHLSLTLKKRLRHFLAKTSHVYFLSLVLGSSSTQLQPCLNKQWCCEEIVPFICRVVCPAESGRTLWQILSFTEICTYILKFKFGGTNSLINDAIFV